MDLLKDKMKNIKLGFLTEIASTNTYARRVTKHHSYDENTLADLNTGVSLKSTELANVDHSYNEALEETLTRIHDLSKMFMLVNVTIKGRPIIFVSKEFTTFYQYSRDDVYLKDAVLEFMAGEKTRKSMVREIRRTIQEGDENTLEHVLYTMDRIPVPTTIGLLRIKIGQDTDSYFAVTFDPFKTKTKGPEDEDIETIMNIELGDKSLVAPILKNKDKIHATENKSVQKQVMDKALQYISSIKLLEDSTIRKTWDWFFLVVTLWATFSVPVQYCFDEKIYYTVNIDIATDIFFLIDIFLNFRTTFVNADGLVIDDSKKMATHYLTGWFPIDMLCGLPWQIAQLMFSKASGMAKGLRLLKLSRVLRMVKVAYNRDEYTNHGPVALMLIITFFLMQGHLFACGWFMLGKMQYEDKVAGWVSYTLLENNYAIVPETIYADELQEDLYSSSLYFIMTIFTTVGFGNISPYNVSEQIFAVCVMLVGAFFYAIIFGSATNLIMQMGAQQSRFLDQQRQLEMYSTVNKFPLDLKNRMEDYFYYQWFNSKGIDKTDMMETWPRTLKEDTSLFLHRILFAEWPVFNEASTGCRRALSSLVERHGFTPGDYIVHEEDCVDSIFFLIKGHVKILRDGDVIGIITKGATFGEKWWPTEASGKANADIQAMTYCEIEVLTHAKLKEILIAFPDYWAMWERNLEITYELASGDGSKNIFDNLPEDLKIYVKSQRTSAYCSTTDEGDVSDLELIRNTRETIEKLSKVLKEVEEQQ